LTSFSPTQLLLEGTQRIVSEMYAPRFTSDPRRIARLQANYEEGKSREGMPLPLRERLDVKALNVSQDDLNVLFENALRQGAALRAAKRGAHNP
jgi:hypothetical protein